MSQCSEEEAEGEGAADGMQIKVRAPHVWLRGTCAHVAQQPHAA